MHSDQPPLDEYTLAAFLAGTLSEARRAEVLAYLAENEDARDLLCMAEQALAAADPPVVTPFSVADAEQAAVPERAPERSAARRPVRMRLGRLAVGAALVVVIGIGVQLSLTPATDQLRSATEATEQALEARVATPALQFDWTAVPQAYYYRVVILDPAAAEIVAQHETRETRLSRNDAFVLSLLPRLESGRSYDLRVDAFDVQNRLIESSASVQFTLAD